MAKHDPKDYDLQEDFPGGQIGSRVHMPSYRNKKGGDATIDPDEDIYSGMTKRQARECGEFTRGNFKDLKTKSTPE